MVDWLIDGLMAPLSSMQAEVQHAQGRVRAGVIARQRKNEVEELNERLRKINLSLRQQARVSTMYAPGLTYAPRDVDSGPSGSGSDSSSSSSSSGGGGGPSSASTATFNWQPLVRPAPRACAHALSGCDATLTCQCCTHLVLPTHTGMVCTRSSGVPSTLNPSQPGVPAGVLGGVHASSRLCVTCPSRGMPGTSEAPCKP